MVKLKSFKKTNHVYTLLTYTQSFPKFLKCISSIDGASLQIDNNLETFVEFRGKEVEDTRKMRFQNQFELIELLKLANLQ